MEYIDIHTHRNDNTGVQTSIINCELPSLPINNDLNYSVGWHPWHINNYTIPEINEALHRETKKPNVIAIGECGLDRMRTTPIDFQIEVFNLHLDIAMETQKPLLIHCVKAYSDLLFILKERKFMGRFILHAFNGNQLIINQLLKYNAWFSLGKNLFQAKAPQTEKFKYIPAERLFFETDDTSYLISDVYLRASVVMGIPIDKLVERTENNFRKLFENGLA
jgi:TatD DNase family protein